jgi:hypothetical protein
MTQPPATDPISDRRRSGFPRPRDGFIPYRRTGPYLELIGPVYETAEGPLVVGLWLDERHTNSRGFIHAGALVALADTLLGHAILREEPTISGSDTKPVATARRSGGEPSSGRGAQQRGVEGVPRNGGQDGGGIPNDAKLADGTATCWGSGTLGAKRVGPENPHPAQAEDAYAGLVWIAEHADELGIDRNLILVMGKSGGGGVAAGTALMARDRGGPALAHQLLIYPMLDDREVTVSSKFEGVLWDRTSNRTGWTALLGDAAGGPDVSSYAAPARAQDLRGLPPAYLETGSSEVFRDEILGYASRLAEAGVPMEVHSWAGGFHSFEISAPEAEISRAALAARTSYVRRALRSAKAPHIAI